MKKSFEIKIVYLFLNIFINEVRGEHFTFSFFEHFYNHFMLTNTFKIQSVLTQ